MLIIWTSEMQIDCDSYHEKLKSRPLSTIPMDSLCMLSHTIAIWACHLVAQLYQSWSWHCSNAINHHVGLLSGRLDNLAGSVPFLITFFSEKHAGLVSPSPPQYIYSVNLFVASRAHGALLLTFSKLSKSPWLMSMFTFQVNICS